MAETTNRNARCHCGSGKKYKNCHGAETGAAFRSGRRVPVGYIFAGLAAAAAFALWFFQNGNRSVPPGAAPPGKVWSAEHGHWHDAP